ncbi:MAG: metallophosphoesterase [Candidatus Aenigmarchaeota archaeon]|nr:metallophosphoesterase [Candidatus Aenigmarchaeota archaeon]MDW8149638.1 metallophosphoesterase [Candidatus Aenigmarchaeota archaeon]
MVRILAISDLHNDLENVLRFLDIIRKLTVDVIVCAGDILDASSPKGISNREIGLLFIEEMLLLNKPFFVVPGNFDKDILDILEEKKVSLHGKGKIINNIGFYGYGGAKTPFNTPLEPDEGEIKIGLYKGFISVKDAKYKVQVTHIPPLNTSCDLIFSGLHVGSKSVREFIEEYQPTLAICAHVQEGRGIDYLKNTVIVNCGRFAEGYVGLIEIKDDKVKPEIINLNFV